MPICRMKRRFTSVVVVTSFEENPGSPHVVHASRMGRSFVMFPFA